MIDRDVRLGEIQVVCRDIGFPAWVMYEEPEGFRFVGPMDYKDAALIYDRLVTIKRLRERGSISNETLHYQS